ncbi:hypothetical protein R1sor_009354 [Riccia sorocarpa]|uniref:Uncharacterized protein n=1 Tax=Riccia sorocarpa TaxID=122646 RepID=A0ABD3HUZ6_9MARC
MNLTEKLRQETVGLASLSPKNTPDHDKISHGVFDDIFQVLSRQYTLTLPFKYPTISDSQDPNSAPIIHVRHRFRFPMARATFLPAATTTAWRTMRLDSLDRSVMRQANGPEGAQQQSRGGPFKAIEIGLLIGGSFFLIILFLSVWEKWEKVKAYFTREKVKTGPVPQGFNFEDLLESRPDPGASADRIQARDQDQDHE